MYTHSNILGMLAIPLFSLFTWAFFKRRGYNFAEHLTANVYFIGFVNLCFTFLITPLEGQTFGTPYYYYFLLIGLLLQAFYLAWAHFQLLKFKKKASYLKTFGVILLVQICWMVLTISAVFIYIYRQNFFTAVGRMFGG